MSSPYDQDPTTDEPIAEPLRPRRARAGPRSRATDGPGPGCHRVLERTGGPGKLRAGAVAAGAVALAVGAVATSLAAAPASAPTTTTPTTTSRVGGTAATGGVVLAPALVADPLTGEDVEAFDHGWMGGHAFRDITISSISAPASRSRPMTAGPEPSHHRFG
jgi:hypothetical protein